ncbi:MAG: DUF126 domain-containing protein [Desulfurococcaceae archaeon]
MSLVLDRIKLKPIVLGDCKGEVLFLDTYLSFFGEVDPETGCLRGDAKTCIDGKILVFRGSRGSTVGPYILYALSRRGKQPTCMIVNHIEPMLIAGSIMSDIPLFQILNLDDLLKVKTWRTLEVRVVNGECYAYRVE